MRTQRRKCSATGDLPLPLRPSLLPLLAVLLLVSPAHSNAAPTRARAVIRATPAFEVIYLEVPVSAIADTRTLLRRYANAARAAAVRTAAVRAAAVRAAAAAFHVDVLQEVGREERWLVLQWADSQSQLQVIDAAVADDLASLHSLLVAPPDPHSNHPLPATASGTATAATTAAAAALAAPAAPAVAPETDDWRQIPPTALYAVTHLDIGTQDQSAVIQAVHDLVEDARRAPGNLLAEAWQQNGHPNHYALLFAWRNRVDRDAFAGAAAERRFHGAIAPLLGSPYDERLYRRVN